MKVGDLIDKLDVEDIEPLCSAEDWGEFKAQAMLAVTLRPTAMMTNLDVAFALGRLYEREHASRSIEFIVREDE